MTSKWSIRGDGVWALVAIVLYLMSVTFVIAGDTKQVGAIAKGCEGISQTPVNNPQDDAWLSVALPPDARNIQLVVYSRAEKSTAWSTCSLGATCNGVAFPATVQQKSLAPEGFHMYWLRPHLTAVLTDDKKYAFSGLAQARLGVKFDLPGTRECTAFQIIEVSPRSRLETKLLAPSGHEPDGYTVAVKSNIVPAPPYSVEPWRACPDKTCVTKQYPHLATGPFEDGGGDRAKGLAVVCTNGDSAYAAACLVMMNYR